MFYSHEILTSREHGVATIWLVATLGAKSSAKKVNRKAILEVDVPKACETIINPEAPMALRLQGNLLYGVSRVYNQQCGYALTDAQTMRDKMRAMLRSIRTTGLDPDAGKAKPDQLVLPDDPTFVPALMLPGLNVDLSILELSAERQTPRQSSLLSSQLAHSSNNSSAAAEKLRLDFTSSDIGAGDAYGMGLASDVPSTAKKDTAFDRASLLAEEGGVLFQPDFEFDEEGNIIELPVRQTPQQASAEILGVSESGIPARVRRELEEGLQNLQDQFDDGGAIIQDDAEMNFAGEQNGVLTGEPFPSRGVLADEEYVPVVEESSEAPEAQQRAKKRSLKLLGMDFPQELKNSDLAQWNSGYVQNMADAKKFKENNKLITQAKKNAAFWVVGMGIGSVGVGIGDSGTAHPLNIFSGDNLLGALTGLPIRTRKRGRPPLDKGDEDSEERRVRARQEDDDIVGEDAMFEDGPMMGYEDIEIGRQAPPSLHDDPSSQMPWNITASIQGSRQGSSIHSRHFMASVGGYSSVAGPQSVVSAGADGDMIPGSTNGIACGRRVGRLTSASPLAGRGRSGLDQLGDLAGGEDVDMDGMSNLDLEHSLDGDMHGDLRLGSPNAHSATDKARWLSSSLDQQSLNFLEYVASRVEKDDDDELAGQPSGKGGEITFSSLLPPESNTRAVATQALMHVLTLATKGALNVHQEDGAYGEIVMSLV